ncbi:hypothetical protein VaNZ11_012360 [Volvox africanus]|uniref:Uncharacterized protein n=1 Tax=Volvox africanus TaxID=51714 RepID=A0ABQ5SDN3_9CHLO|nr:hypothetical protein VaNZ11_012360 [Volvox africanus]
MASLLALPGARIADNVAGRCYPAASGSSLAHIPDVYEESCIAEVIDTGAEGFSLLGNGLGALAPPETSAKSCNGSCGSFGLPKSLDTQPNLAPQLAVQLQPNTSTAIRSGTEHNIVNDALGHLEAINAVPGCCPSPGPHMFDANLAEVGLLGLARAECSVHHDPTGSLPCGPRTYSCRTPQEGSGCCLERRLGPEARKTQRGGQWRTKRLACGSQRAHAATAGSRIGPDVEGAAAAEQGQAAHDLRATTWQATCSGDRSGRCRGRPCVALRQAGEMQAQPLLLPLLLFLLTVFQVLMAPRPCAAASWPWIWGKAKAASAAVGDATPSPSHGWQFGGLLPYGWRKHGDAATSSPGDILHSGRAHSSSASSRSTDNKTGRSRSSSRSGSSKSRGSRTRITGQKGPVERVTAHEYFRGDGTGVVFSAGNVPVPVNPAGNVTELLEYDPLHRPPPPAPPPVGTKRFKNPIPAVNDDDGPRDLSDAQLALRELLIANRFPYNPMEPYKLPAMQYVPSDFVFATGSFSARYILAQSTRSWRRGIRAFIAVNNTEDLPLLNEKNKVHQEHYEYFPDDGTGDLGKIFHGYMAGDTRAAMAPFLAHQYFGETYKWMLYGDDDTLFYMPAVKRMLAHLDPELPIAISDNLWFRARHPNLFAPRCLPCHLAVDADPPTQLPPSSHEESSNPKTSPHPQTKTLHIPNITAVMNGYLQFMLGVRSAADMESAKVQKLLTKNTFGDFNKSLAAISHLPPNASVPGVRYLPRPACPFCTARAACTPRPPKDHNVTGAGCFASGGHGGAGIIFSVGLLRRLSPERMKQCFMKIILAPGGDGMLSACLWEAGYAFTDPGASTLARYDGNYLLFSSEAGKWMLHDPLTVLLRGKCDGRCKWLLRNAASHHGRGRHFQNFEQSAAYLFANIASYTATHKWLAFMAGRDEDLTELQKLIASGNSS